MVKNKSSSGRKSSSRKNRPPAADPPAFVAKDDGAITTTSPPAPSSSSAVPPSSSPGISTSDSSAKDRVAIQATRPSHVPPPRGTQPKKSSFRTVSPPPPRPTSTAKKGSSFRTVSPPPGRGKGILNKSQPATATAIDEKQQEEVASAIAVAKKKSSGVNKKSDNKKTSSINRSRSDDDDSSYPSLEHKDSIEPFSESGTSAEPMPKDPAGKKLLKKGGARKEDQDDQASSSSSSMYESHYTNLSRGPLTESEHTDEPDNDDLVTEHEDSRSLGASIQTYDTIAASIATHEATLDPTHDNTVEGHHGDSECTELTSNIMNSNNETEKMCGTAIPVIIEEGSSNDVDSSGITTSCNTTATVGDSGNSGYEAENERGDSGETIGSSGVANSGIAGVEGSNNASTWNDKVLSYQIDDKGIDCAEEEGAGVDGSNRSGSLNISNRSASHREKDGGRAGIDNSNRSADSAPHRRENGHKARFDGSNRSSDRAGGKAGADGSDRSSDSTRHHRKLENGRAELDTSNKSSDGRKPRVKKEIDSSNRSCRKKSGRAQLDTSGRTSDSEHRQNKKPGDGGGSRRAPAVTPKEKKQKRYSSSRKTSSEWNDMIEAKMEAKKNKHDDEIEDGIGSVVPPSVIVAANEAVQTWKDKSGMHLDNLDNDPTIVGANKGEDHLEPTPEEEEKKKKRFILLTICLVLVVLIILGIVVGVTAGKDGDDEFAVTENDPYDFPTLIGESPTPSPSKAPTWSIFNTPTMNIPPNAPQGYQPVAPSASSQSPVILMVDTVHPIDLILDKVPEGYVLSRPVRNTIVSFVKDKIGEELDDPVSLVDVSFADDSKRNRILVPWLGNTIRRRLAAVPIPMIVTVNGPADISGLHLLYVMEVLEDTSDLSDYLRSLDPSTFEDVIISIESDQFELDGVEGVDTQTTSAPVTPPNPGPGQNNPPTPAQAAPSPDTPSTLVNPNPNINPGQNNPGQNGSPMTSDPTLRPITNAPTTSEPSKSPVFSPTPYPTRKPTPVPVMDSLVKEGCPLDVQFCPDGSAVNRNPFQMCNFFPCPANQSGSATVSPRISPTPKPSSIGLEYVATKSPTLSPSFITDSPTNKPNTMSPTPAPSPQPSPSPTPKPSPEPSRAPTTESPSENPTLHPTSAVFLVCSPDPPPAVQCGSEELPMLEKCTSSDTAANDQYGNAIDINTQPNGDVYAIVGARRHSISGSAYLISYDKGTSQFSHVAEFIPGGASANGGFQTDNVASSYDQFGYAVKISDSWVAISAPFDTASQGKVSLFRLNNVSNGGQLEPDAELVPSDKSYGARFGSSLAMDGDTATLVAGAPKDRSNVGSAYVYRYNSSARTWVEMAKLLPDTASSDSQGNFGTSVAISGGLVAVGAPMDGTQGRRRNGGVFIYSEQPDGSYTLIQTIIPSELLGGDQFGFSLSMETHAGETKLAIGAKLRDDKGIDSGSVYIYRFGDNEFSYEQKLTAPQWSPAAEMGFSLDMHEDKIIVGAKNLDNVGGAYYFQFNGVVWVDMESVTPVSVGGSLGDDFGSAVALTSSVALVGSYSNDEVGVDGGSMYSYAVCG